VLATDVVVPTETQQAIRSGDGIESVHMLR
jgi:hypothetical protein